jgi:hypothetical protein
MADRNGHDRERERRKHFVLSAAEPGYKERQADCHAAWDRFNQTFFGGQLVPPHFDFGRTAPRSLGHVSALTGDGVPLKMTIRPDLIFGPDGEFVRGTWPVGRREFVEDFVLRFIIRQHVLEVEGAEEAGYRGFGPLFTAQANRIGVQLGYGPVVERHRPQMTEEERWPLAAFFPHNVRLIAEPLSYDGIPQRLVDVATGGVTAAPRLPPPPTLGLLELLLNRINHRHPERAIADTRELLIRQIDRLQETRLRRYPVRRRVEEGVEDVDGSPLIEPPVDRGWLAWNNGTVPKLAEAILAWRAFAELPILADALEDAGCTEGSILRHLREKMEHTQRCWVLRRILAAERPAVP